MRIEEALEQFLVAGRGTRWGSERTAEWYRYNIESYLTWLKGKGMQGSWLQRATIERFLASERERGLSPYTLHARHVALDAFLDYLVSCKLLGDYPNPLIEIPCPKLPKNRKPKTTELIEFRKLLESIDLASWTGLRDRVIVQVLFFSGLRVSELIGLRTTDVSNDGLIFVRSGKGDKDRLIPYAVELRTDLLAYLYSRPAYEGVELFLSNDGAGGLRWSKSKAGGLTAALTAEGVRQMLRRRCKKLGLRHLNPHAFRHGNGMILLNSGLEMSAVAKILGHSSVKITEQFYAHWLVEPLKEQYNAVVKKL